MWQNLAVVDKGVDLNENNSGVEDASNLDSDVEELTMLNWKFDQEALIF